MTFDELPEKSRRHLELEYSYGPFPDDGTKSALAQLTGLATEDVTKWFEAQRQRNPDPMLVSYRKQPREDEPWLGCSASSSETFGNSRHLALRFPEAGTSSLESVVESADSAATIRFDSKSYEAAPEDNCPPERKDEGESTLPGLMVFTASGERLKARRRRPFDASRRMEVAKVRKLGACAECRARKIRCKHTIESSTAATKGSLPSDSRASSDTPEHQMLDRSNFLYDSFIDLPVPINASFFQELKIGSSSSLSSEQPSWTVSPPLSETFSEPRHPPRLRPPSRPQTPEVANSAPAPPQTDVCLECGFKPEGDPKWHRSNLARHMRARHSDTAPEFACPVEHCAHAYRRSDNLKAHMRKAHGERPEQGRGQGALLSATQARAAAERGDRNLLPAAAVGEQATPGTAGKEMGVGAGSGADSEAALSASGSGSGGGSAGGSGAPGTAERKFRFVFSDGSV